MDPIKILFLEDNYADAELAEYALKSAGMNFISKIVETEAQYRQQLNEFLPDIIISDFELPLFNGFKAFKIAKEQKPDVPFILFTGAMQEERAIEILTGGATDYVMKSRLERLVPAVERALKEAADHKDRIAAEAERDLLLKELEKRVQERTQDLENEINERRKAEQQLARELDAMTRLQKISSLSAREGRLEEVLMEIVDAAIAISGADFGNIQLLDAASGDLRIAAQRGFPPWWIEFWNSVTKGRGTCGTALERGERVIVEDVELSPIFVGTPALDIQLKAGVRAVQSTPLVSRSGKPVGMFSTHYRTPRRADVGVLRLIDLLARQAADLIENASAEDTLRESELRLRLAQEHGHVGVWDWNLVTGEGNISDETHRIYGLRPGTICTYDDWINQVHPDDRERVEAERDAALARKEPFNIEFRILHSSDDVRWICARGGAAYDDKGRGVRLLGINFDITERKRADEKLRRSEEEYRLIVEKAPTGIYEIDFKGPRFKSVNDAMCLILGYTRQELMNLNPLEILDEESKELFKQRIERILAGKPVEQSVAYVVVARDGRKIWAELDIKIKDSTSALVVGRDVTERKRVEKALQASEEKFSKAFRNSPNAITITRLSDGRIIEGNESAYELFGYTHEEVLGKTTDELNIWAKLGDRQRLITGLAANGFVQNEEFVLQKKDKTPIYVSLSASLITIDNQQCFLSTFVDITERKRAENLLLEIEKRFRSVLDNSRDAIYRFNIQSGCYEYISPAAEQIVGYSPEELMVLDVNTAMEMVHPEDLSAFKEALARSKETGQAEAEYRQKTKDGQHVWISNSMSVIRDAVGKPLYRDGVIHNITERKNAEEKLRRRTAELESAVAELDSFAYSVSHDLRAPLRAIDGFSRMLLKGLGDKLDPEDARKLHVISRNSEKMGQLIEDLLKLSRTGRIEIQFGQLNIKSVVEDTWKEIRAGNPGRNLELIIGDLPPARGDLTLLRQVFSNLIDNAVKFTKNRENAVIEVIGFNAAEFNTYCVKDNGAGFDMKHYGKLFEVFHRLHGENQYEGTGVGLAIVKKIIDRHGGRIWAESKSGEGATFYFTIPAVINNQ